MVPQTATSPRETDKDVETTYRGARTTVRTNYGRTDEFTVGVGLHQGSVLSPFLFIVVMNVISENFRTSLLWEILFADDSAFVADSEEELQRRWLRWQIGMESEGLKGNTKKTEVMASNRRDVEVNIKDKDNARLKWQQPGTKIWTMGKKEKILEATEMRTLRRTKGVTLTEREISTDIRRALGVSDINEKVKEKE
ncbi:uncharacterized protein LOC125026902 [Penaeus chinensis]|uniref:uncharacterized protein LOC125026902 n=1 Tax=Penaeus chinensis TaxID=139456 RepID=UPI001FB77805|nr:uncharacterized protein LOC125026902 [Penaeus chinensis]